MAEPDTYNRPTKGILKVGKHPPLTRSASLQSKRTCFKEEKSCGDVGGLSKTFNFGCSLDVSNDQYQDKYDTSRIHKPSDFPSETIQEIDEEKSTSPILDQDNFGMGFAERRKSFELKPLGDCMESAVLNLKAILGHQIPLDDDEEEDDGSRGELASGGGGRRHVGSHGDTDKIEDVEMMQSD